MLTKKWLEQYLLQAGVHLNGNAICDIKVHNENLYKKIIFEPSLGAGESYVDGWWDCEALDDLFFRICRHELDKKIYNKWHIAFYSLLSSIVNFQTRMRSQEVAAKHYNLGNSFYSDMLGPTMSYTCGYWPKAATLEEAQNAKFDLICRKIRLQRTDRVLDLGCGWGTLAKYMAERYGCEVVAVNISTEQVDYAQMITKELPVSVYLTDYRDASVYNFEGKPFDKIVSVGLCEHVGHKNYRDFMKLMLVNLKEDGLFLLHTIGKNNSLAYIDPWTNKYIFPNGILPSIKLLADAVEDLFVVEELHNFGADYDKTLMSWYHNFHKNWPKHQDQYGERFFRLWSYYLLSCAGAFRGRTLQLWHLLLSPKGVIGGSPTIR